MFAVAEQDGWRGLVLDLRLNDGGFDSLGLALASRLTDTSHFAFQKRARNSQAVSGFTPYEKVQVSPSARPGFHGPIALLVSDLTVSAGETAVMTLLNRSPKPTLIGRPTQGIFSDTLSRTLPGGWSLDLSSEDCRNAAGQSFEGRGIPVPPDFRTPVFTDTEIRRRCDSAVARALDHLANNPPGTTAPCPRGSDRRIAARRIVDAVGWMAIRVRERLDLAEAVNVALAADYGTEAVLPLDRRDFRAVRPLGHHRSFRVLPDDIPL